MKEDIYREYNSKNYTKCLEIINLLNQDELPHDLAVLKANSNRVLENFDEALINYYDVLRINSRDYRSALHALNIQVNYSGTSKKQDFFYNVLGEKGELSLEESRLLILFSSKFKCTRYKYKVRSILQKCIEPNKLFLRLLTGQDVKNFDKENFGSIFYEEFELEQKINMLLTLKGKDFTSLSEQDAFCFVANYFFDRNGYKFNWINYLLHRSEVTNELIFSVMLGKSLFESYYEFYEVVKEKISDELLYSYLSYVKTLIGLNNHLYIELINFHKRNIQFNAAHSITFSSSQGLNNIIIFAPALLSPQSSYVTFIKDYIFCLKKIQSNLKFKIIVTDELFFDVFSINFGPKHNSRFFINAHYKIFNELGDGIEIDYISSKTTSEIVKKINDLKPDLALYFSAFGTFLYSELIYKKIPSIYLQTNMKDFPSYNCDLYLTFLDDINLVAETHFNKHKWAVQKSPYILDKKKEAVIPKEYLDFDFDFVFITVGSRLDEELTDEFVIMILDLMNKLNSIKVIGWLIVGNANQTHIFELAKRFKLAENVKFKRYESNLTKAYSVSDLYINPPRTGGGISIAYSIMCDVPAVAFKNADASPFLGEAILKDSDKYANYVYNIIKSNISYDALIRSQKLLLKKSHSADAVGKSLLKNINNALLNFKGC